MNRSIPRTIFATLAIFLIIPICAGNVHEVAICYLDDSVETGDIIELEQGYRLTIGDIRKNDAAISIFNGSEEILNTSISGDYIFEKEIDGINYDIIRISMNLNDGDPAPMVLEQYRDPGKPFDYPLIDAVSITIKKGEREPLKAGYGLEATSIIDNNVVLTLYKGDDVVKQEKLSGSDKRFIHTIKVDGQRRTILIAKLDRISNNDSVQVSGLSQFEVPESTDEGDDDDDDGNWNLQLVESTIFQYLLSIFVFACVFVMILGIARRVRK
ncbi:MAG: hypothetical protein C4B59_04150 [Candidatus Methanogaster sp.]|uniref:Uncharacterized protein n=1 Tax=Candidatus Methanogaster sp. TaxID=3386292 RepID=A0AC61L4Z3_9EURY|nr:MAG: hypothetical protein C4B59_04150 [ANME-2 cluster archaeon]